MSNTTATPSKLRNGTWGATTTTPVNPGETITIRSKAGKTWDATVTRVLWTDGQKCLVATAKPSAQRGGARGDGCDQCGTAPADTPARDMAGLSGMVCRRCAAEGHLSFA